MIYAVIDTNVLVSALMSKSDTSTISQLIDAMVDNAITPLHNAEILAEYREVLAREKFCFNPELRDALIDYIADNGIDAERVAYNDTMPDESDRVFYEVALSKEDAYLITGNLKHFPKAPIVVTPAEMLNILLGSQTYTPSGREVK